jgi:hypothetical protein
MGVLAKVTKRVPAGRWLPMLGAVGSTVMGMGAAKPDNRPRLAIRIRRRRSTRQPSPLVATSSICRRR